MTAGIPLPLIPTHRTDLLNEELAFDVQLYSLQAKALAHLEEARTAQAFLIWNVVEHYRNELSNLDSTCPSNIRRFFLNAAKVQLTTYGFLDLSQLTVERLREMHFFACSSLETLQNHQNEPTKTDTAPIFVGHLGMSGDTFSRAATILMQLCTSKKIFRKPDGTVDSLSLQCVQRQGMNVVFSCFWWWRWEFNAQSFPYENSVGIATAHRPGDSTMQHHSPWSQEGIMSGRGDLVTATGSAMDEVQDTGDVELPDAADFNFNYEWLTIQDFLCSDSLFI
ncbi:hypothetical protein PRZ48_000102 [Zasmidium cellare]|uniref:Uncharacterized protein n=1 Tax=Zasmidium cellare TaxID=395010 RepID=A0ABR0EXJ9_ZASCE|nr:hypothetical protein PRZ48_000102 [Zasmidium cellare]